MAQTDQTLACRTVLVEVANVLGAFRDHMVLIGGWVPELYFPNHDHIGSLDVDFAVSPQAVTSNAYETILTRMTDAGYSLRINPTHFTKIISGAQEPVKVDLLGAEYSNGEKNASIQLNELQINCLSGIDLAFLAFDEKEFLGTMPDGAQNVVRIRIVRPEAFILIKAFALDERIKEKDAYDIAFVLRHYQAGLAELAEKVRGLLTNPIAERGYLIMQGKFAAMDSVGPIWAARICREQGEDYEQVRRAAFENAQDLFRTVNWLPQP